MIAILQNNNKRRQFHHIRPETGKLSPCLYKLLLRYHQYLSEPDIFSFFPFHGGGCSDTLELLCKLFDGIFV